jgi:hypothetical protein
MNESEDLKLREFLKQGVPGVDAGLRRDLWPSMLRRMETNARRVPWFDWVLLGAVAASLLFVPRMIPMLLYHL